MSKFDELYKNHGDDMATSVNRDRMRFLGCRVSRDTFDIELDRIVPDPEQPRKEFDEAELLHLAASMKQRGQLQPCRVRWDGEQERFVLVDGERRWRAAKLAGMRTVQCVVDGTTPDDAWFAVSLTANCLRSDLSPMERAKAYQHLMDNHGWTAKECAERLHLHASTVSTHLRLLELPDKVQSQVDAGELSFREALDQVRAEKPKRKKSRSSNTTQANPTRTIKVSGATIVVKTRKKAVSDADLVGILEQAISQIRQTKKAA